MQYRRKNNKVITDKKMLKKEDFIYFGKFTKPHGTKGEIGIAGEGFLLGEDCDFVACDIDGILVPFFIEESRTKNSDTIIVKLELLDSAESVRFLTNRSTYIPREWVDDEEHFTWNYFVGFEAEDEDAGNLGEVTAVDDSTINTLFVVERNGEEILIPASEEMIVNIDHEKRVITFKLPDGLIDI